MGERTHKERETTESPGTEFKGKQLVDYIYTPKTFQPASCEGPVRDSYRRLYVDTMSGENQ